MDGAKEYDAVFSIPSIAEGAGGGGPVPPIPEPVHRITPTSSGMSVRRLPKVTLEQVLKVCQHYEQKCSGKYSSKTLAARYVFALSREVSKLVSTLRDVRSLETSRLAYLEELMREWEEVFGQPSRHILMGAAGDGLVQVTPRSVHAALRRAEERCVTVEGALDALRSQHQAHIDRFEAVIDEHHAASRKQYHSEMTRQKRRFHAESEQVRMNADAQLQEAVVNVEGMARDESARLRAQYGAKARELHDTVERRAEELAGEQRALREDRVAHEAEAREMARRAVSCDKQLALAEEMVRAQASRIADMDATHAQAMVRHEVDAASRLRDALSQEKKEHVCACSRAGDIETENRWLRGRVLEQQSIVKALQGSLFLDPLTPAMGGSKPVAYDNAAAAAKARGPGVAGTARGWGGESKLGRGGRGGERGVGRGAVGHPLSKSSKSDSASRRFAGDLRRAEPTSSSASARAWQNEF